MGERVVLILGHAVDSVAHSLVRHWEDGGARLLTPDDLSSDGWYYRSGSEGMSTAIAAGSPLDARNIFGVLNRLPYVLEDHLVRIAAGDRAYLAAEMQAFLHAWLSVLPCPVLNRPPRLSVVA